MVFDWQRRSCLLPGATDGLPFRGRLAVPFLSTGKDIGLDVKPKPNSPKSSWRNRIESFD